MFVRRRTYEALLRQMAKEREEARRDRRELLDRIMYMADKPWMLPVHATAEPEPDPDPITYPDLMPVA